MSDSNNLFGSTPASKRKQNKTKRVGQALKRILALIDHEDTPHAQKIELAKEASKLARQGK